MRTPIRWSTTFAVPFAVLTGLACGWQPPGCGDAPEGMDRATIEGEVYASDTRITYRDGETPIGALFEEEHRLAVDWDELPVAWVVGIVAAEDGRFWSHSGVDPKHIARATRENVAAGGVVSGGSTLTQQTAKNLFDRADRSLEAKWEELDYALHLEKTYSKREILTFYANQFHVTGNGAGIGIAARYFFDAPVSALGVLESAYIAGLVKGPANYDPFPGDEARQASASERAHDRTRYVLQRIIDEPIENLVPKPGDGKAVTQADVEAVRAEAARLLDQGFTLPFRKGSFRFDSSALLDEVTRRLQSPTITAALAEVGIDDPTSAGLTIVTTLDPGLQHEAVYGLWHQLTDLGVMLEGLGAEAFVQADMRPPLLDPAAVPKRHEFRAAVVTRHTDGETAHLEADLGGFPCTVDRDAIVRAALAVERGRVQDRYAKVPTASVDALLAAIPDGAVLWTSVRSVGKDGADAVCDLELRPELQGSTVVVEDGQLRAMVSGSTSKDFNRALALRQLGSTFKPLVYHAAMTLGWQPDDAIDNRRTVFPFSGTWYVPSPDHEPSDWISLAWAGVNSENLASIWLLYHLTDHLTPEQVAELARTVGLARGPGEPAEAYSKRIQEAGVLPTRDRRPESFFLTARSEIVGSLLAQGRDQEARELRSLYYGWGFSSQRAKASSSSRGLYDNSWLRLWPEREALARAESAAARSEARAGDGGMGARPTAPEPEPEPEPRGKRGKGKKGKGKASPAPDPSPEPEPEPSGPDDRVVRGSLTMGTLEAVDRAMERQQLVVDSAGLDLYDPEVLYGFQDFRVLLAIRYVTHLAKTYGVQTELAPVMSLPLGASEITLEEAAVLYEGLVSGERRGGAEGAPGTLIAEIRDRSGDVVYQAEALPQRIADPEVGQMTADILRNVVRHGTGRGAAEVVEVGGAQLSLGGKTGTTNDFRNAAFVGFTPGASDAGPSAADGSVVAVYVGYDDNRPMSVGRIRVAGAVGALPAWIAAVQGVPRSEDLVKGVQPDGGYWPLAHGGDLLERPVSTHGLPVGDVWEGDGGVVGTVLTRPERRIAVEEPEARPERSKRGGRRSGGKNKRWWSFWE
jgi:penicillin-binding protein 1A